MELSAYLQTALRIHTNLVADVFQLAKANKLVLQQHHCAGGGIGYCLAFPYYGKDIYVIASQLRFCKGKKFVSLLESFGFVKTL